MQGIKESVQKTEILGKQRNFMPDVLQEYTAAADQNPGPKYPQNPHFLRFASHFGVISPIKFSGMLHIYNHKPGTTAQYSRLFIIIMTFSASPTYVTIFQQPCRVPMLCVDDGAAVTYPERSTATRNKEAFIAASFTTPTSIPYSGISRAIFALFSSCKTTWAMLSHLRSSSQ